MINSEIFREIQNLEAKADEIISSTNEEIIKLKEEAKEKITFQKTSLEEKLNSYLEEKKRELNDLENDLRKSLEKKYLEEEDIILKRKDEAFNKIKEMFINDIFKE
jgi:F0F1-type ATP synthase membrane subunit b/b'